MVIYTKPAKPLQCKPSGDQTISDSMRLNDTKSFLFPHRFIGFWENHLVEGGIKSIYPKLSAHYLDEIGVPTFEEMTEQFGGPAQWQALSVHKWIENINQSESPDLHIMDGQARPMVIKEAVEDLGISSFHITLIECSHMERRKRLLKNRIQPELDNLDTYAWSAYLRGQADALEIEIIDTTGKNIEESIGDLAKSINRFAEENNLSIEGLGN